MDSSTLYIRSYFFTLLLGLVTALAGCAPVEPVSPPTLDQARTGNVGAKPAEDARVRTGEIEAEVVEVNRTRREIYVVAADGRRETLPYDFDRTRVVYRGREYTIDNLESADRIAYRSSIPPNKYIDIIRVEEPVQTRSGSRFSQALPPRRTEIIDGTVERIDQKLGVFDIQPHDGPQLRFTPVQCP